MGSRAGGKFVVFTKNLSPNNSLALLCLPHIFSPNCSPLNLLSASEPVILCTFLVSFFIFSVPRIFQLVFVLEMVYSLIKRFPRYLKIKGFSETWNEWSLSTRSKENAQGNNLFQLIDRPSALLLQIWFGDLESSPVVSKEDTSKFKPNHHLFVSDKKHFHIREHLL